MHNKISSVTAVPMGISIDKLVNTLGKEEEYLLSDMVIMANHSKSIIEVQILINRTHRLQSSGECVLNNITL